MRARAITLLIGIACASVLGCSNADKKIDRDLPERREREPEPRPSAEASPGDFPVIEIGANRAVRMDGVLAGDTTPMVELQQLQKLDELFNVLKEKRELWKSSRADKPFPGVAGVRVQPDTSGFALKSVMQTAAFAGYPTLSLQIIGAPDIYDVTMQLPSPPGSVSRVVMDVGVKQEGAKDLGFFVAWKVGDTLTEENDVAADKLGVVVCDRWRAPPTAHDGTTDRGVVVHWGNVTPASDLAKILGAIQGCASAPRVELSIR